MEDTPTRDSGTPVQSRYPAPQNCAFCRNLIKRSDSKITVHGGPYHPECWEQAMTRKNRSQSSC